MSLSERRRRNAEQREQLDVIRSERVYEAVTSLLNSEQYNLEFLKVEIKEDFINAITKVAVESLSNPIFDLEDTLRGKGYKTAEIKSLVRKIYNLYCIPADAAVNPDITYEEMLEPVAEYCRENPGVYSTLK